MFRLLIPNNRPCRLRLRPHELGQRISLAARPYTLHPRHLTRLARRTLPTAQLLAPTHHARNGCSRRGEHLSVLAHVAAENVTESQRKSVCNSGVGWQLSQRQGRQTSYGNCARMYCI
jgi:hypothetical protein